MTGIIEELSRAVRRGNIILWAGAGLSLYAGLPSAKDITQAIRMLVHKKDIKIFPKGLPLADLTEEYVRMHLDSRASLYKVLTSLIDIDYKSVNLHQKLHLIPQLRKIITTNYDHLFEDVFKNDIKVAISDKDLPQTDERTAVLYKIHGTIERPETILITRSDYTGFFENRKYEILWSAIRFELARNSILFMGYGFDDQNIRAIIDDIIRRVTPLQLPAYLVAPRMPKHRQNDLARHGINYIDETAESIIDYIHDEVEKHLVEDVSTGLLTPAQSNRVFEQKGIQAEYAITANGRTKVTKLIPSKTTIQQPLIEIILDLSLNPQIKRKVDDFLMGKSFGDLELAPETVKKIQANVGGIPVPPSSNKQIKVILSHVPSEEYNADLVIPKLFTTLMDATIKVFRSQISTEIEIAHKNLVITISASRTGKIKFDYKPSRLFSVFEGLQRHKFIRDWTAGNPFIIVNKGTSEKHLMPAPNFSQEVQKSAIEFLRFFEMLENIQEHYNILFTDIDNVQQDDLNNFAKVVMAMHGSRIPIESLEVDLTLIDHERMKNALDEKSSVFRVVTPNSEKVSLFGSSICIGRICVETLDGFISNASDVINFLESGSDTIHITIKSRSNELFYYYIKSDQGS